MTSPLPAERRHLKWPRTLQQEHPGVWYAHLVLPPRDGEKFTDGDELQLGRLVVAVAEGTTSARVLGASLVHDVLHERRYYSPAQVRFPAPAALFALNTDQAPALWDHRVRWFEGETLLVVTSGPVEAVAVICERERRTP